MLGRSAHLVDPYKNFKFRVNLADRVVAGFSKISSLKRSVEPLEHRERGDAMASGRVPMGCRSEPLTLERGLTHDGDFARWMKLAYSVSGDAVTSLADFRRDLTIELLDERGKLVHAYEVYNCWVSECQVMAALDTLADAVFIERMVLQNEAWARVLHELD